MQIVVGLSVGALLWACGEETPDAVVNDDISWRLGCASTSCSGFNGHDQTLSDRGFDVSCKKGSLGLNITITDPGSVEDNRPKSILQITNLNGATNNCTVTVTEALTLRDNPGKVTGTCRDGACTVMGGATNGWDFEGTLSCTKLVQPGAATSGGTTEYRLVQARSNDPVQLKVDNCN